MSQPNATRDTLCHEVMTRTGKTREEAKAVLEAFLEALTDRLAMGENIEIRGWGTLYRHFRRGWAAKGESLPGRGATISPGGWTARWRPSADLVAAIRGRA